MMEALAVESILECDPGKRIRAEGRIDPEAEFFQDHFPEFPILPGVLALEIFRKVCERAQGRRVVLRRVSGVKFARYLKPGEGWQCELVRSGAGTGSEGWRAKLTAAGKTAVQAHIEVKTD